MNAFYVALANAVLITHVLWVAFVVLGLVLIAGGGLLGWRWVRNRWFRLIHLAMMLIVAAETAVGMTCPLTTWENQLRELGGQETVEGDFIALHLQNVLFFDFPPWVFTALYYGFAGLILVALFLVPPRWRKGDGAARGAVTTKDSDGQDCPSCEQKRS